MNEGIKAMVFIMFYSYQNYSVFVFTFIFFVSYGGNFCTTFCGNGYVEEAISIIKTVFNKSPSIGMYTRRFIFSCSVRHVNEET